MSQKSGKKLRKRLDDEVETLKTPGDEINIKENAENGIDKEGKCDEEKTEETEMNNIRNDNSHSVGEQMEKSEQDEEVKEIIVYTVNVTEDIIIETNNVENDTCVLNINNKDDNEEIKEECEEIKINIKSTTENEMEPLLLETEEVDPELEFDENSDVDSQKSSPANRCKTRRSQTRNIPTPKTPKVTDANNDDKSSECSDKPSVVTVQTSEITDTESEVSVFKSVTDIYDPKEKLLGKNSEELDSFQNISTKAVVGSDTTRNVDLSLYPDEELEFSPFLSQSRERSVGETLKLLSSRRSIKSTKDYTLQNNKKDYKTLPPPLTRKAFEKSSGTKRKNADTPEYSKRFKSESPHLLSYISSPIANFKNRFVKSEIPSSTPKLTGYKSKNLFDNTNVSKISLNETEDAAEKKWCTIM